MTIRSANQNDAPEIARLVSSLSHFYLESACTQLPEWFSYTLLRSEFERRLSSDEFSNYVYTIDDSIIGYISIKGDNHLYHLFVDENHQGRGVSRKLWEHASALSAAKTFTVRSSIYAVPIYKHFGFIESSAASSKEGIRFQAMKLER